MKSLRSVFFPNFLKSQFYGIFPDCHILPTLHTFLPPECPSGFPRSTIQAGHPASVLSPCQSTLKNVDFFKKNFRKDLYSCHCVPQISTCEFGSIHSRCMKCHIGFLATLPPVGGMFCTRVSATCSCWQAHQWLSLRRAVSRSTKTLGSGWFSDELELTEDGTARESQCVQQSENEVKREVETSSCRPPGHW